MSHNSTQKNSFKKNIVITYALAIPMLITMAILMAVFAYWKNEYLIMLVIMIAGWSASIMAHRQRKLEYWTFKRRTILFLFSSFPAALVPSTFIVFGQLLSPHIGLAPAMVLAAYLSLSNVAIFLLVYRMEVPTTKRLGEIVEREAKRSRFLMRGFLYLPLLVLFAGLALS